MKRRILSLSFAAMFIGVATAMAGLDATPIQNHSFESVNDGAGPTENWGYVIDDWYENEQPNANACYFEVGSSINLVGESSIWAGAEAGGKFYQSVGTVDDGVMYKVTALIGDRGGNRFGTGAFSLYASTGGATGSAADGVELSSFATLITNATVTTASGIATENPNVYTVTVLLPTGTGHAGEVLWLEFGSVSGKDYFDNIAIELYTGATPPAPEWTTTVYTFADGVVDVAYDDTLAGLAIDANGDAITYGKSAGPAWLSVAADGSLSGTPVALGTNTFTVTATDGTGTNSATLLIPVRTTLSPVWSEPVTGKAALVDAAYTDTLDGKATDPDGESITYTLQDVGTWLSVAPDGAMTGAPTSGDTGTNTFTVAADDGVDTPSQTTLTIVVRESTPGLITINNADFEDPVIASGNSATVTDWTEEPANTSYIHGEGTAWYPVDTQVGYFANATASINQDLAHAWSTSDQFRLEFTATEPGWRTEAAGDALHIELRQTDGTVLWSSASLNLDGTLTGSEDNFSFTGTNHLFGFDIDAADFSTGTEGEVLNLRIVRDSGIVFFDDFALLLQGPTGPAGPVADLVITDLSGGAEMVLSWTGVNGKPYGVETNSNLIITSGWQLFKTGLIGDGGTISVTNAIGPDQIFYRVISE